MKQVLLAVAVSEDPVGRQPLAVSGEPRNDYILQALSLLYLNVEITNPQQIASSLVFHRIPSSRMDPQGWRASERQQRLVHRQLVEVLEEVERPLASAADARDSC